MILTLIPRIWQILTARISCEILRKNDRVTPLDTVSMDHNHFMKTFFLISLSSSALFLSSCGGSGGVDYDTAPISDYPAAVNPDPADPTYGAAAYEDHTTTPAVEDPTLNMPTEAPAQVKEHVVVAGDSLWKISKQYGVSIDAIKAANQMTKDTVILGKKMIIPAP
jgi:hypothetical protein